MKLKTDHMAIKIPTLWAVSQDVLFVQAVESDPKALQIKAKLGEKPQSSTLTQPKRPFCYD